MAGVEVVIHLVGFITETSRITYEKGHIEATRHVLIAAKQAGVTRWIQMSAAGTRPHARSRYHRTKWQAEELVRASGLDWTIFRPSLVYGHDERDRLLNLLKLALSFPADFVQLDSLPLIDGGRPLVQPVHVQEVARCFAAAPFKEAAIGRTFDLVGPVAFTWREMVFKILGVIGRKGTYEEIPLLLFLRTLLWTLTLALPIVLVAAFAFDRLDIGTACLGLGIFALLALLAARWRSTLIFSIPGELLIQASEPLNGFAPRALCPSEVLKMSVEDNTGDPLPAMEVFAYTPEPFEQGLARIFQKR